jgi:hypothetical protein
MNNAFLFNLEKLIANKKDYLLKKYNEINDKVKTNEYLEPVKDNYISYNNSVIDEKTKILNALNNINNYLDNLLLSNKLNSYEINQIQKQQNSFNELISLFKNEIIMLSSNN